MGELHILLLPVMAHGHTIPILDMAKLFTSRGLKTTIISTPSFSHPIKRAQESGHDIGLSILRFPPEKSSLPGNILSLDQASTPDLLAKFFEALSLLQEPVEKLLQELSPNCLISDVFLPCTTHSAAKFGIPRLVFHGISGFALCASEQMHIHKPYKDVTLDSEPFVLPSLPHSLTFIRTQVPKHLLGKLLQEQKRPSGLHSGEPDYDCLKKKKLGGVCLVLAIWNFLKHVSYMRMIGSSLAGLAEQFIWIVEKEKRDEEIKIGLVKL